MSDLRRDIVSGEWIIMSPNRAKRPHLIVPPRRPRFFSHKEKCPFEEKNLRTENVWPPLLRYPKTGEWKVGLIPNKFPAVTHHQMCGVEEKRGPHTVMQGIGHHDLVITRDHRKNFAELSSDDALGVLLVLQERYRIMAADRCLFYTSSFMNWGATAGASVSHPHYQVLTLPIIPPDIARSLEGAKAYFQAHRRCVHCTILAYERKDKKRVLHEDAHSVAFAPFVSRNPFEVRIFPKRHFSFFEHTPEKDLRSIAAMLQNVLRRVKKNLNDADFNFFLHTAPLKRQAQYGYYHWHIEVVPKITIPAGFELSTGVDINVVDPEEAVRILRK